MQRWDLDAASKLGIWSIDQLSEKFLSAAYAGDSGGPILIPDSPDRSIKAGKPSLDTLIGLTSFGDPNCKAFEKPGGYTLIAPYLNWMHGIMNVSYVESLLGVIMIQWTKNQSLI